MSTLTDLAVLIVTQSRDVILQKLFDVLSSVGVDAETWHPGDPTREELYAVATQLETYEQRDTDAIKGGFLDTAEKAWLSIKAASDYNTPRREATYAGCTIRLTSTNPNPFDLDPDDLTVSASVTGKTYRNTGATPTDGTLALRTLAANGTLDLLVLAEEAGSSSSALTGEIDTIVSPAMANVTVTNLGPAVGLDEELDPALRVRARGKLGALSPNGPWDGYRYVATTPELNGGVDCTDARVIKDSTKGEVTVYLRGSAGAVTSGTRTAIEDALELNATPNVVDLTVVSASNLTQAVTYELWVYNTISRTTAEIQQLVSDALLEAFASRPIGGDIIPPATTGKLYKGFVEATILRAVTLNGVAHGFRVAVTLPAADVSMSIDQVLVLGTVTPTSIHLVTP